MFRCGSFNPEEDDPWSPSSARRSRRKQSSNNSKNPYSARGLDKFAKVLEDLEARRQKILSQVGSLDVALVRFVYSNSHEWVPIVVKPREKKQDKKPKIGDAKKKLMLHDSEATAATAMAVVKVAKPPEPERRNKKFSWGDACGFLLRCLKASYYSSLVLILILLCLVMFGRSFAILCTTAVWYAVPAMNANGRRSMVKKDYTRKLSDKKTGFERPSQSSPLRKRG